GEWIKERVKPCRAVVEDKEEYLYALTGKVSDVFEGKEPSYCIFVNGLQMRLEVFFPGPRFVLRELSQNVPEKGFAALDLFDSGEGPGLVLEKLFLNSMEHHPCGLGLSPVINVLCV